MLWIIDGGMISLPVIARVEDFKEDSYIEITGADENNEWKSEPTRYEAVTHCKDCKYYQVYTDRGVMTGHGFCASQGMSPRVDEWFCADGVRKEQSDGIPD